MPLQSKIIPFDRRQVTRRVLAPVFGARPELHILLDMLRTGAPDLFARFTAQTTHEPAIVAAARTPAVGLLQPPPPANDAPCVPYREDGSRARTLTSLVFPQGAAKSLTASAPGRSLTLCLG